MQSICMLKISDVPALMKKCISTNNLRTNMRYFAKTYRKTLRADEYQTQIQIRKPMQILEQVHTRNYTG